MSTVELLMTILRSEVLESEELEVIKSELTEEALEKLYKLSKAHDLAHIVASALIKLGKLGQDELSKKWNKQFLLAVYRRQQQNEVLEQLCALFEENRIEHIPLKGSVLCNYYPEPWMRTSCDIDILIHPEDTDRAIEVLCGAGFTHEKTLSLHDYSFYSDTKVHIELHIDLSNGRQILKAAPILKESWKHTHATENHTFQQQFSNEFFLFYHIAHMAKHFVNGGCGVRSFLDLYILKKRYTVDEKALRDLLLPAELLEFYNAACETVIAWFSQSGHSAKTRQMEQFVLTGGIYGTAVNEGTMKAAHGVETGTIRHWLKAIFLPRKNMELLYPKIEKHPILLPYYHVKRWFGIFRKDKRQKIKNTIQIQNEISPEATQSATDLLVSLGLDKQIT